MTITALHRKRRILYRSNKRGCKETDLLLGQFVDSHLDQMTEQEVDEFEHLLDANDADLYSWITGRGSIPEEHNTSIMSKLINFKYQNDLCQEPQIF